MKVRRSLLVLLLLSVLFALFVMFYRHIPGGERLVQRVRGRVSAESRLSQYGEAARGRWLPYFQKAGLDYPPQRFVLVGLKEEHRLEIYAAGADGDLKFVRDYPILAASGNPTR